MKHLVLIGSTHGNEWTGAYLIRHLEANKNILASDSYQTHYIFANEKAFQLSQRYVEKDLNRCFNFSDRSTDRTYEEKLARNLKRKVSELTGKEECLLVDMHTTTAAMGTTLIVDKLTKFNLQLLSFLCKKIPHAKVFAWIEEKKSGFINELSDSSLTIEVGPVERATLKHEAYQKTLECVRHVKDFMLAYNDDNKICMGESIDIYVYKDKLDYPRDKDGHISAMIHKEFESKNFQTLLADSPVFCDFFGNTIQYGKHDNLQALFIGEASYYEKGFACCLAKKTRFVI